MRPNLFRTSAIAGLSVLVLSACAGIAPAGAVPVAQSAPMPVADIEIIDRSTGERLPIYRHRGERWVAGVPGHRYAIGVQSQAEVRLLAVMSVDGLNVLSGETAGWDQRGYVFAPGERYEVAGWRKSQDRIAAFEFASLPDSYAARTGRPENVGVIGVALFREAFHPAVGARPLAPLSRRADADGRDRAESSPSASPSPADVSGEGTGASKRAEESSRLGTAHGRSENSWVSFTAFERAQASPDEVITIRYDRRENLVAMGVIAPPTAAPDPFPSSILGFVPDPPPR
jgi:hypothetical protein